MRRFVVLRQRERPHAATLQDDRILETVHFQDVDGIVRVDQDAHQDHRVVGPDRVAGEHVGTGIPQQQWTVVVLTHDERGDVATRGVRQREGDIFAHIDDGAAVEGVTVLSDDRLIIERLQAAAVIPRAESDPGREAGEHEVGLGASEIANGHFRCGHEVLCYRCQRIRREPWP
uniref:hypothetical protein n=1 Tax=Microbacterium sp. K19 TaxID=2305449 RepID=UPI001E3279AF|nr:MULTISPECIES: hypothetical protein [unclassified Microbacterium]